MPYSYDYFKIEVGKHLVKSFPPSTKILDVGAGSGKYGAMLRFWFNDIDALEIFEPYIEQFKLNEIYNNVHIGNIIDFDISIYDYIIMGDILEHLSVENAHDLLSKIHLLGKKCLVAIPYTMEQGEVNGNIYEKHLQSDLTHDVFLFRYPMMKELYRNHEYGYYINY